MKALRGLAVTSFLLNPYFIVPAILVIAYMVYVYMKPKSVNVWSSQHELRVNTITDEIIKALGVHWLNDDYSKDWSFTEDEEKVIQLLLENESIFQDIHRRYNYVGSRGLFNFLTPDFIVDLRHYLSEEQINQIKHLWS